MPKLGEYQFLLDIVAFLYPDEASARAGRDAGGTGFFVTIPSATYPEHYHHAYAVTNHHVALGARGKRPCPVVRVNKLSGPPEVFPFDDTEWQFMGGGPDVAVVPITLNPNQLKVSAIAAASFFLTAAEIAEHEINAAEDVFMLGRFIDYDGIEENLPSMRFGNISMMAAKVQQPTGYSGNSYVVENRVFREPGVCLSDSGLYFREAQQDHGRWPFHEAARYSLGAIPRGVGFEGQGARSVGYGSGP